MNPRNKHTLKRNRQRRKAAKKRNTPMTAEILSCIAENSRASVPIKDVKERCRKGREEEYDKVFALLQSAKSIVTNKGKVSITETAPYIGATVARLCGTFGFVTLNDNTDVFIRGKNMLGAMPGDRVLIARIPSQNEEDKPQYQVERILRENTEAKLTGTVCREYGRYVLDCDGMPNTELEIVNDNGAELTVGDKVMAEIAKRGKRHSEHTVRVVAVFGSSEVAANCALSILLSRGIKTAFDADVLEQAEKIEAEGIHEYDANNRRDFRDECIFTIDGADTKDIDDAISLVKTETGYCLSVHIADVSNYVKPHSALDREAMKRGTSIYYADRVIPMLPSELSNGICSLNPGEDRLTLSAVINFNGDGEIVNYEFCKGIIRSRIQGVYKEINSIFDGSDEFADKYAEVLPTLMLMRDFADILIKNKTARNAVEIETVETKLIINGNGICVDARPAERGLSQDIIEVFMLSANQAASMLAREKKSPFVYRIHEAPPAEKADLLREVLEKFGYEIEFDELKGFHINEILSKAKGTEFYDAINKIVLRSMAKAKYSHEPIGHFGLALDDYAHFTSPIRRYPDLAIHRIITDIIMGHDIEYLKKRYEGFAVSAAEQSTNTEMNAVTVERECEDCYKAECMKDKIGEEFECRVSGITEHGIFVMLENTVEGFVHVHDMPPGEYVQVYPISLVERLSNTSYSLGDAVRVRCDAVNVSEGSVRFGLVYEEMWV